MTQILHKFYAQFDELFMQIFYKFYVNMVQILNEIYETYAIL